MLREIPATAAGSCSRHKSLLSGHGAVVIVPMMATYIPVRDKQMRRPAHRPFILYSRAMRLKGIRCTIKTGDRAPAG